MSTWYAIRVKANREHVTERSLCGRGYEAFLPLYAVRPGRAKPQPLFPGYVFSRFDARDRMPVVTSPGIVNIVSIGKVPAPVPDGEIDAIRSIVTAGIPIYPWPYLKEGQRVRITKGSLTGLEGVVAKSPKAWRVVASITLLQRSVAVEIDRHWIEPVADSPYRPGTGSERL